MNSELNGLIAAARSISYDAQTLFGKLNEIQLNWQPNPESWSVGLCFEHLIKTNNEILGTFESHVTGAHRRTVFERLPYLSRFFGEQILKAVQPENRSKRRAPRAFTPTGSSVAADVVEKFVANQQKIIELMQASHKLDLHKTIVTSPAARFIVFSLFDAYKILITHERRHFRQAQNVMQIEGFPKY